MPMIENEANFINKWHTKPWFAGANDLHTLPPTCNLYEQAQLGYTESSTSYHLDATCTKIKGGSSWFRQTATIIKFIPIGSHQTPDPRFQPTRMQHQLKASQALTTVPYIPSVSYVGGPFPLQLACEGTNAQTSILLTSLSIQLKGTCLTRSRSSLFHDEESSENQEIPIITAQSLSIPIGPQAVDLMSSGFIQPARIPEHITPCLKLFTISQPLYRVVVSYTLRAGNEVFKGKAADHCVEIPPSFF